MMIVPILLTVDQVLQQIFKLKKALTFFVATLSIIISFSIEVKAEEDYLIYYSENKKSIFSNLEKPLIINNYVYSISIVESLDEVAVIDRLKSKSELLAISNITKNYPKYNIKWPSSYSNNLIDEIWKHHLNNNISKIEIDDKQYINIDNGFISKKEDTSKYFFSVIVFQKSYLDSLFSINFNNVFNSLKK